MAVQTEATQYVYRVRFSEYTGNVEVAIYDPERWDGKGGARFGYEAEVYVDSGFGTDTPVAQVSQGSICTHSPADARLRIDVYTQAANIAEWINNMAQGASMVHIGEVLAAQLPQGAPTTDRPALVS